MNAIINTHLLRNKDNPEEICSLSGSWSYIAEGSEEGVIKVNIVNLPSGINFPDIVEDTTKITCSTNLFTPA